MYETISTAESLSCIEVNFSGTKRVFLKTIGKIAGLGLMVLAGNVLAEEVQSFQPFDLSMGTSSIASPTSQSQINSQNALYSNVFAMDAVDDTSGFDFLGSYEKGYHLATNKEGLFGNELVVGMKFADWLTLRLNVIDENESMSLFSPVGQSNHSSSDFVGYQFGVSSVMNISENWRLGFDLGRGRVGGDLVGLYQDRIETTRLGFGIRNQKFGATFQSDFMNRSSDNELEQSTMDLQVDWHFTRDGTISFGARRSVNENNTTTTSLDQFTGTVPYIKFKHNL